MNKMSSQSSQQSIKYIPMEHLSAPDYNTTVSVAKMWN